LASGNRPEVGQIMPLVDLLAKVMQALAVVVMKSSHRRPE
jgi:hypothetical protein